MAKRFRTKSGKTLVLLNPSEKARKAAVELKANRKVAVTTGEFYGPPLTDTQRAYRAGRLDQQTDGARAYNAKKGRPGNGRSAIAKNGGSPPPKRGFKGKGNGGGRGLIVISDPPRERY